MLVMVMVMAEGLRRRRLRQEGVGPPTLLSHNPPAVTQQNAIAFRRMYYAASRFFVALERRSLLFLRFFAPDLIYSRPQMRQERKRLAFFGMFGLHVISCLCQMLGLASSPFSFSSLSLSTP